ncbi:hypothetical protein ABKN59_004843 [Abortiporus biennis]
MTRPKVLVTLTIHYKGPRARELLLNKWSKPKEQVQGNILLFDLEALHLLLPCRQNFHCIIPFGCNHARASFQLETENGENIALQSIIRHIQMSKAGKAIMQERNIAQIIYKEGQRTISLQDLSRPLPPLAHLSTDTIRYITSIPGYRGTGVRLNSSPSSSHIGSPCVNAQTILETRTSVTQTRAKSRSASTPSTPTTSMAPAVHPESRESGGMPKSFTPPISSHPSSTKSILPQKPLSYRNPSLPARPSPNISDAISLQRPKNIMPDILTSEPPLMNKHRQDIQEHGGRHALSRPPSTGSKPQISNICTGINSSPNGDPDFRDSWRPSEDIVAFLDSPRPRSTILHESSTTTTAVITSQNTNLITNPATLSSSLQKSSPISTSMFIPKQHKRLSNCAPGTGSGIQMKPSDTTGQGSRSFSTLPNLSPSNPLQQVIANSQNRRDTGTSPSSAPVCGMIVQQPVPILPSQSLPPMGMTTLPFSSLIRTQLFTSIDKSFLSNTSISPFADGRVPEVQSIISKPLVQLQPLPTPNLRRTKGYVEEEVNTRGARNETITKSQLIRPRRSPISPSPSPSTPTQQSSDSFTAPVLLAPSSVPEVSIPSNAQTAGSHPNSSLSLATSAPALSKEGLTTVVAQETPLPASNASTTTSEAGSCFQFRPVIATAPATPPSQLSQSAITTTSKPVSTTTFMPRTHPSVFKLPQKLHNQSSTTSISVDIGTAAGNLKLGSHVVAQDASKGDVGSGSLGSKNYIGIHYIGEGAKPSLISRLTDPGPVDEVEDDAETSPIHSDFKSKTFIGNHPLTTKPSLLTRITLGAGIEETDRDLPIVGAEISPKLNGDLQQGEQDLDSKTKEDSSSSTKDSCNRIQDATEANTGSNSDIPSQETGPISINSAHIVPPPLIQSQSWSTDMSISPMSTPITPNAATKAATGSLIPQSLPCLDSPVSEKVVPKPVDIQTSVGKVASNMPIFSNNGIKKNDGTSNHELIDSLPAPINPGMVLSPTSNLPPQTNTISTAESKQPCSGGDSPHAVNSNPSGVMKSRTPPTEPAAFRAKNMNTSINRSFVSSSSSTSLPPTEPAAHRTKNINAIGNKSGASTPNPSRPSTPSTSSLRQSNLPQKPSARLPPKPDITTVARRASHPSLSRPPSNESNSSDPKGGRPDDMKAGSTVVDNVKQPVKLILPVTSASNTANISPLLPVGSKRKLDDTEISNPSSPSSRSVMPRLDQKNLPASTPITYASSNSKRKLDDTEFVSKEDSVTRIVVPRLERDSNRQASHSNQPATSIQGSPPSSTSSRQDHEDLIASLRAALERESQARTTAEQHLLEEKKQRAKYQELYETEKIYHARVRDDFLAECNLRREAMDLYDLERGEREQVLDLLRACRDERDQLDRKLKGLQNEKSQLVLRMKGVENEKSEMENRLRSVERERDDMDARLKTLQESSRVEAEGKAGELKSMEARLVDALKERDELSEQLESDRIGLKAAEDTRERFRDMIEQLEVQRDEALAQLEAAQSESILVNERQIRIRKEKELKDIAQLERIRRLEAEKRCVREIEERLKLEVMLDDVRREVEGPLVVPAMMEAFELVSRLTGDVLDSLGRGLRDTPSPSDDGHSAGENKATVVDNDEP